MESFGALLADAILRAGMTRREFATRAGCTSSLVTEVIRGRRKPPLVRIEAWADLLMAGDGRADFVRRAHLAHATGTVQQWVAGLLDEAAPRRVAEPKKGYRATRRARPS